MEKKKGLKKLGYIVPSSISFAGYLLVRSGIEDGITKPKGFTKVFAGRMLDLLDGFVARKMDWSTTFGKYADFILDKKATQEMYDATVVEGIIPSIYKDAIVSQEATTAIANGVTRVLHPGRTMGRTEEGAYAMAAKGLILGGYALAEVIREYQPEAASTMRAANHVLASVGIFHNGEEARRDYVRNIV